MKIMIDEETVKLALEALHDLQAEDYEGFEPTLTALRQAIEQAQKQDDHLKWKLRGYKTLDPMKNERIAESFGWGKGASYDDCLQCSVFKLDEFSNAIRMDERDIILQGVETPEPDKSSLFTFGALESYAATCVTKALQAIEQAQPEANERSEVAPVAWGVHDQIALDKSLANYTPPQRQPLTDEQIEFIRVDEEFTEWGISEAAFRYVARAIEAAHGIKGEA